jgi:osmotically-inducible protein OsmY
LNEAKKKVNNHIACRASLDSAEKGVWTMNTNKRIVQSLLILLLVVGLAACASTSKQSGAGEYVDDTVITTKIKSLLAADDFLKSFEISVETYKGTVQLSGFVNTRDAVNRAGEIARSVQGVGSVKNNLSIKG